jgi:hypothetical protein
MKNENTKDKGQMQWFPGKKMGKVVGQSPHWEKNIWDAQATDLH